MHREYIANLPHEDKYLIGYWVTKDEFAKAFVCRPGQAYKLLSALVDLDVIKRREEPREKGAKGSPKHQYLIRISFSEVFKEQWDGTLPRLARMAEGKDPNSSK